MSAHAEAENRLAVHVGDIAGVGAATRVDVFDEESFTGVVATDAYP